jgi:short-subunit dehydrogenase
MSILQGSTVLITGASSGIGRELARLAAKKARRLVLVARRADRLEALRAELAVADPETKISILPCDLSDLAAARRFLDELPAQVGDIDVLINNAGVGDFGLYDRCDWNRTESLLALNVTSLALLTHRLIVPMVARGRGGVLNISSGYGFSFSPGMASYIGSKHFVTGFTESLRLDLAGTGVVVSQCCPGPVATEFESVALAGGQPVIPKWLMISAEACARAALRGFERGRAMIVPGLLMKFLRFLVAVSPRFMQRLVQAPVAKRIRKLSAARE